MARSRPNVLPFRRRRWTRAEDYRAPRARRGGSRGVAPLMVMLPLAAFTALFLWDGPPEGVAAAFEPAAPPGVDREVARFGLCNGMGSAGGDCVIDGDTFWYRGEKVRIADINTPEVSSPGCAHEARLGAAATARLQDLLNQGAFSLERDPFGPAHDKYGRALRVVTREAVSLGGVLVREGLAEEWQGYRRDWC